LRDEEIKTADTTSFRLSLKKASSLDLSVSERSLCMLAPSALDPMQLSRLRRFVFVLYAAAAVIVAMTPLLLGRHSNNSSGVRM